MRVEDHKITTVPFNRAHHVGRVIKPFLVVLHDTAGRLRRGNSAAYLRSDNPARVSCHFIIERDGSIEQQVELNRRANHAGVSNYHGRQSCNDFSIGIEFVNPGRMSRVPGAGPLRGRAWWGEVFSSEQFDLVDETTTEHGAGVWMGYTPDQIVSATALLEVLFRDLKGLIDIRPHWYISPRRKIDTNPLFPLEELRAHILGPSDPADIVAEAGSEPVPTAEMLQVVTGGARLNLRRWPYSPQILTGIPNGTLLAPIREGVFDGRRHHLVNFDNREGWIVSAYTRAA